MELSSFKPTPSVITGVIVAMAILFLLMWAYHHLWNTMPVGSLTATQYGQLAPAAQVNYTMNTSGYWVPKGTPTT